MGIVIWRIGCTGITSSTRRRRSRCCLTACWMTSVVSLSFTSCSWTVSRSPLSWRCVICSVSVTSSRPSTSSTSSSCTPTTTNDARPLTLTLSPRQVFFRLSSIILRHTKTVTVTQVIVRDLSSFFPLCEALLHFMAWWRNGCDPLGFRSKCCKLNVWSGRYQVVSTTTRDSLWTIKPSRYTPWTIKKCATKRLSISLPNIYRFS